MAMCTKGMLFTGTAMSLMVVVVDGETLVVVVVDGETVVVVVDEPWSSRL